MVSPESRRTFISRGNDGLPLSGDWAEPFSLTTWLLRLDPFPYPFMGQVAGHLLLATVHNRAVAYASAVFFGPASGAEGAR
jgi:hypothetical protein